MLSNGKNQTALENLITNRVKELIAKETSVIILLYYMNRLYNISCYYYSKAAKDYKLRLNQLIKAENDWKKLLTMLLVLLPQDRQDRWQRRFETVRHKLVAEIIIERLKELLGGADEDAKVAVSALMEPIII